MIMEKFFFRPFVGNFNRTVMVCIAVTIVAQTAINILEGGKIQALPVFVEGVFKAGPMSVSYQRVVTFVLGVLLLGVVSWFVNRTKWGVQMQAISQNMTASLLQGINVHRISMLAVALGCGLAALAGCLMGAYLQLTPFMGDSMLTKVLILVVLAGVGSIGGIFITGLVLGGLDAVLPAVIGGAASDAIAVCIVTFLLLVRPQGFFGHEMVGGPENEASSAGMLRRPARARRWAVPSVWAGFLLVLCILPLALDSPYALHILTLTFIYVIASSSLRTITISGQFPMAHGAYMGIGAYCAGLAAKWLGDACLDYPPRGGARDNGPGHSYRLPIRPLEGALLCHGQPLLRHRRDAILFMPSDIGRGVIPASTASRRCSRRPRSPSYYFFLGMATACLLVLHRLEFSRIGISLKAIAQSHMVASSVGINEVRVQDPRCRRRMLFRRSRRRGLCALQHGHRNFQLRPDGDDVVPYLCARRGHRQLCRTPHRDFCPLPYSRVLQRPQDVHPLHLRGDTARRRLPDAPGPRCPTRDLKVAACKPQEGEEVTRIS